MLPLGASRDKVVDVLFWSGGKDSYLSLLLLEQHYIDNSLDGRVVLLTTFEGSSLTGEITHQGLCCRDVMNQAKALGLDLLLVPLPDKNGQGVSNVGYKETVTSALSVLREELSSEVLKFDASASMEMRLVFGDLHLQDIRAWRESTFSGEGGFECMFPAFGLDYSELQGALWTAMGARGGGEKELDTIQISAWSGSGDETATLAAKGVTYDEAFVSSLPASIDGMGERGEFHTHVVFSQKKSVKGGH